MQSMQQVPLRYNISSWYQLPQCLSNNSRELRLHVTDIFADGKLQGLKIHVEHATIGVLFACIINMHGSLVSRHNEDCPWDPPQFYEMDTPQILEQLHNFGFFITYCPREHLGSGQLEYLITLDKLHFDKIRILRIQDTKMGETRVIHRIVAFVADAHGQWLNNDYQPSMKEFTKAVVAGTACNLTEISDTNDYRWDWLDYVANISDIIRDNAKESPVWP